MLLHSGILSNKLWVPIQSPILPLLYRVFSVSSELFASISSPRVTVIDDDCNDFLPWLEQKARAEISSVLAIGKSPYGRTLYASENIQAGDCLLKVPYSVQLSPDNLPTEISYLLCDRVSNVSKVALLILHEKALGLNSEWSPYISRLPQFENMHSTILWSDEELKMIGPSVLYGETVRQKARIEKDFQALELVVDQFPDCFQDVTLEEFRYAYGLVTSRAWESSKGVSLIPFADFLNHDGTSEAHVLSDESKRYSEVIADCDFASGDEVLIRYGKFSNATLLLDFGFTVSCNNHDQALLELSIPQHDKLYAQKLELLDRHRTPSITDVNEFTNSGNAFMIKGVRCGNRKGKGIPQSLRAFARILTCNSQEELNVLAIEASQNDGRLARHPLKNKNREIAAHQFLLSEICQLIEEYHKHIKFLEPAPRDLSVKNGLRRGLAYDLLSGELRVLKSTSAWLENHCSSLKMN